MTASAELVTFWGVTLVLTALSAFGEGWGQRQAFDRDEQVTHSAFEQGGGKGTLLTDMTK